ncbi:hypothetical protein E4U38_005866, partial [Claviceps purpurea]
MQFIRDEVSSPRSKKVACSSQEHLPANARRRLDFGTGRYNIAEVPTRSLYLP